MADYISKQRAKDLMGCCLASAKAEYKSAKDEFTKARFEDYISTIQAMINVVGSVEAADVQPVKRGFWKALMMSEETGWDLSLTGGHDTVCEYVCSVCGKPNIVDEFGDSYLPNFCPYCGARMIKDGDPNG